jgi:tetratricopeptide (TPR) repeat protein
MLKAIESWDRNDLKSAEKYFKKALDIDSSHDEIWFAQGELFIRMGKITDAISSFEKAFELNSISGGISKKKEFFKPYRSLISVNTVDGFQGQERDIILISLVRANEEGQIGFLRDLRRMNVAITRARMKLIILGDASTMTRHPFYKRLYDYIEAL